MYKFVDTTERQEEQILPSEALNFNGVYFENVIPRISDTICVRPGDDRNRNYRFGYGDYDGSRYRRKR